MSKDRHKVDGRWRWGIDTVAKRIDELRGKTVGKELRWDVFQIDYAEIGDGLKRVKPKTVWIGSEFSNEAGGLEFKTLLGHKAFDTPKPLGLLKTLMEISLDDADIVLDFFAGSASIGEALYEFNKTSNYSCNYIAIQIPDLIDENEEAYKLGYAKISEISKDRLKQCFQKKKLYGGFKSLKLDNSAFKSWKDYQGTSVSELENRLDLFNQSPLREGYTNHGLLTEIMLLEGFTLCSTITPMAEIASNDIKRVQSDYCTHNLLVCLDAQIAPATISNLQISGNDIFICLDSAINTTDKLRLSDKGLIKTI